MEIFNDLEKFRSNQRRSPGFASLFHLFYYICSKFYDYLSLAKKKKKIQAKPESKEEEGSMRERVRTLAKTI